MTPHFDSFREVCPFLERLYSVTSSEGLEDPRRLREYEDAVNALTRCKPVRKYFEHVKSECWEDEGLEFMSTLRGLSEEIVGTFLCDELPSTAQLEEYMRKILRAILIISLYSKDIRIKSIDDIINEIDKAMFFDALKRYLRSLFNIIREP